MRTSVLRSAQLTPCKGICTATNLCDAVCNGCGRTAEQVRDWITYDVETKKRKMQHCLTKTNTNKLAPQYRYAIFSLTVLYFERCENV